MKKLFENKTVRRALFALLIVYLGINWLGHHTMYSTSLRTTESYSYKSVIAPFDSQNGKWASGIIRDDEWYVSDSGWDFEYTFAYTLDHTNWTILVDADLEHYEAEEGWIESPYTRLDSNFGYVTSDINSYFIQH